MTDLLELGSAALGAAREGELVEAFAEESRRTQVKVRGGGVDALSRSETRGVGVRVIVDGRLGYAWAADPGLDEARDLVARARESAAHAGADEANVLARPALPDPLPGLFREVQAAMPPERKVAVALDLERAAISGEAEVRKVEDAIYGDAAVRVAVTSTLGIEAEYARTVCWCVVAALAERGDETQSGFAFATARELDELDWLGTAKEAAQRGARLLGGVKPSTERLPVVMDPRATASFLGVLAGALSAEEVQKGRSLLAERVGDRIGAEHVSVTDDGRLPEGPAAAPVDDEGVPTGATPLIERGVLRGFLHNTQTAHRAGASSTGNAGRGSYRGVPGVAPSNLFLAAGSEEPRALLDRAGRAVYVQDVTGVHSGANPVTGQFSVGATGLRVEGGELREPLREMTIASTMLEVLEGTAGVGSDLRFFGGGIGAPTLLVGEMTVAGA